MMATKKEIDAAPVKGVQMAVIKNLSSTARDYPKADGESVYLSPAGRGHKGTAIPAGQVSKAMRRAERAGAIEITVEGGGE